MSAFIVEDQIINRVVDWLNHLQPTYQHNEYIMQQAGYDVRSPLHCKRLAEDMFTLNCESIEQRYGEGEAEKFRDLDFRHKPEYCLDIFQVLKSLQCFLYQCSEGSVPEQSKLYKALKDVEHNICYHLVSNMPQYEAAKW